MFNGKGGGKSNTAQAVGLIIDNVNKLIFEIKLQIKKDDLL